MTETSIKNILKILNKPLRVIALTALLFYAYNMFLVDNSLNNLRFAIAQTAASYDTGDLDGLDIIMTIAIIEEIEPIKMDSQNIMNLEFARNIAVSGKAFQQLDHVKMALESVVKNREKNRAWILAVADKATAWLKRNLGRVIRFPRREEQGTGTVDLVGRTLFQKAREAERAANMTEAAGLYERLLNDYPDSEKASLVALRLGYVYHRMGLLDKAEAMYRKIRSKYFFKKEAEIAGILLRHLLKSPDISNRLNSIIAELAYMPAGSTEERQTLYYEIGMISLGLFNFEEAEKFFNRASKIDPDSELGLKAYFNRAWVRKDTGAYQDSLSDLMRLKGRVTRDAFGADVAFQIADIYHREGRYEEAIAIYLDIADMTGDPDIGALSLFQAAASYMYDMNDAEKGQEIFALLLSRFPESEYAKYLAPDNPVGIFVTYLVPRATRIVAWRVGGLLALSGFTGELVRFKAHISEENLNVNFNAWLRTELPDTVGNIYVDIAGTEIFLEDGKAKGGGVITMGSFDVRGDAEGQLTLSKNGRIDAVVTKAILEKIPIHPMLINGALNGLSFVANKYLPVIPTAVSIEDKEFYIEGYGPKGLIRRAEESLSREFAAVEVETEDVEGDLEGMQIYSMFNERFPGSTFSPDPQSGTDELFYDFFTRMYFYISFKMMEAVKDSSLDYHRSIRTLGRLVVKKDNFRINYDQREINSALNKYAYESFPWLIDENFLVDVRRVDVFFRDDGIIEIKAGLRIGYGEMPVVPMDIEAVLRGHVEIQRKTGLPLMVFEAAYLNGDVFDVEKLNQISRRCGELLKDTNMPVSLEEVVVRSGRMTIKGKGARDFVERMLIGDPSLFTVFYIRKHDLSLAGIKQLERNEPATMSLWRDNEPAQSGGRM
jgi:tetratricopeptide (TPR) repeat protein